MNVRLEIHVEDGFEKGKVRGGAFPQPHVDVDDVVENEVIDSS